MPVVFKRILVATDFSESSEAAWNVATSLALRYDAEILLLHVVTLPTYDFPFANIPKAQEEARHRCERLIEERALEAAAAGLRVTPICLDGKPGETIAQCAVEQRADLAIVGAHGRHGLNRLLLGSVAERVVRLAPCAVLTVKSNSR